MRKIHFLLSLVLLLGYTGTVFAQQPTEEEMAEMMKNMMPGEIHE